MGTSMLTHDFLAPIPPGTLRISVIADDERYAADFPTNRLSAILEAFAEHAGIDAFDEAGQQAVQRSRKTMAAAVQDGDAYLVAVGALWLFLKQPSAESEMHGDALTKMIAENGACLLAVTVNQRKGSGWDFRLFTMPRWPASIPSQRTTARDTRRQWR
jgi:hypothetical protein